MADIIFDFIGNLGLAHDAYGHAFWQLNNDLYLAARSAVESLGF